MRAIPYILTLATALLTTGSILAQSTDDTDVIDDTNEGTWLEEVVVTAQRREQSAMDVPISVMVFDAKIIEQNNMKGAADYLMMTPNSTW